MRLRSAGLGKTELIGAFIGAKKVDDLVIFYVDVTKPTKWHTKMGFNQKDLRRLVLYMLRPKNLLFIIRALLFSKKKVNRTETF